MQEAIRKAKSLVEAMAYIRRFKGKIVVVKLGGSVLNDLDLQRKMLVDVAFMSTVGMHPIIVHGGGKAITNAMEEAGLVIRTDTADLAYLPGRPLKQITVGDILFAARGETPPGMPDSPVNRLVETVMHGLEEDSGKNLRRRTLDELLEDLDASAEPVRASA